MKKKRKTFSVDRSGGTISTQFASRSDKIFDIINILLMGVITLLIFYPLYFVLVASFTDPTVVHRGNLLLYPVKFFASGYKKTFSYDPLWRGYLNSFIYTGLGTLMALGATLSGGYALSRKDMGFRRPIMLLFTFTMFFGGGMIPSYLLMRSLGIYDTLWVMVLPSAVSVYNLIVCRTFFEGTLPDELLEAAQIDGCSDLGFFFRIALPLSGAITAVLALFYASTKWNSYFDGLIYLMDERKMPLQIVLRNLLLIGQSQNMVSGDAKSLAERKAMADQLKFCVIVVSAAPLLVVYPFLQKYFAKGVLIGAVKG
jgi:putative aldouronate transport system permease protein